MDSSRPKGPLFDGDIKYINKQIHIQPPVLYQPFIAGNLSITGCPELTDFPMQDHCLVVNPLEVLFG